MSIEQITEKIKPLFRPLCIALGGLLLLGLWQLHTQRTARTPLKISTIPTDTVAGDGAQGNQAVIGSKTGTKYYFPWCGALNRIKQENRVQFASPILARQAGYEPAKNCKGVK